MTRHGFDCIHAYIPIPVFPFKYLATGLKSLATDFNVQLNYVFFSVIGTNSEMKFSDINWSKDSSLLHHAIYSLSNGGFLKKPRVFSGFNNIYN